MSHIETRTYIPESEERKTYYRKLAEQRILEVFPSFSTYFKMGLIKFSIPMTPDVRGSVPVKVAVVLDESKDVGFYFLNEIAHSLGGTVERSDKYGVDLYLNFVVDPPAERMLKKVSAWLQSR